MLGGMFRAPTANGESITLDTTSTTKLKTRLAAGAFDDGTTRVTIQNVDASATVYWAYTAGTAPANTGVMGIIPAGGGTVTFLMEEKDLDNIYICSSGASKIYVMQEGI